MNVKTQPTACRHGAETLTREHAPPRKSLLRLFAKVFTPRRKPGIEERYLAQAVDAQDLQVRLAALERSRP